jgi:hypothetical protein
MQERSAWRQVSGRHHLRGVIVASSTSTGGGTLQIVHGARDLPGVYVDGYSADVKDEDGYFGQKASNGAFRGLVEGIRERLRDIDKDPIEGDTKQLSRKQLDRYLLEGDTEEAGIIFSAVEKFAQNLSKVTLSLLKLGEWTDVERILVGGGFRDSKIGELVIGRADILVKERHDNVSLMPIRLDPDEAGVLGSAHLIPPWLFKGSDYIIGVDIGGSNFRCGLIELNLDKAKNLRKAGVVRMKLWRHVNENLDEDGSTATLGGMINELIAYGKKKDLHIAPYIGVGCPGTILENGNLEGGVLNLPGDWGDKSFNLVKRIREMTPSIGGHETMVVMHNDAVVQGLSDAPYMTDVERWGIVTIGTGLGNAVFRNKSTADNSGEPGV